MPAPTEAERVGARRSADDAGVGTVWRIMAERMTASWTTAPHFYLFREVTVSRLIAWREQAQKQTGARVTYTDLLVKLVAAALSRHPRVNASWTSAPHFYLVREVNVTRLVAWLPKARKQTGAHVTYTDLLVKLVAATLAQHPRVNVSWKDGTLERHADINIGLAVALEDGLVVPVLHKADTLGLKEIATRREDLVARAQSGKLRPADIQGGVFTISNLGMYGVDAFSAIVNPPQAAILAVGRITDRVVPVNGQPAVQPTMVLTLSCDHRALDGARGAQFLGALADLVEEPLALLV